MDDREYRRAETEARRATRTRAGNRAAAEDALARYLMTEAYDEERREKAEARTEAERKPKDAVS